MASKTDYAPNRPKGRFILFVVVLFILLATPAAAATLTVTVSPEAPPAFANRLLDTNVPVADFTLAAAGGDVTLTAVTITVSNATNAGVAFTSMRVFFDINGDGVFDAGDEIDTFQNPAGSSTFTFTENFTVLSGLARRLQVQVDIGNIPAVYGETFIFSLASSGDLTRQNGGDSIAGTFPVAGNAVLLRNSITEIGAGSGNPTSGRNVAVGTTNAPALHFKLDSKAGVGPGELVGLKLESLEVTVNLGAASHADVLDSVELYSDNGNTAFEPGSGDNLILRRTPAETTKWQVSGTVLTVTFDGAEIAALPTITTGTTRSFWIAYDLANSGSGQLECQVKGIGVIGTEGDDGDFIMAAPAAVSGGTIFVVTVSTPSDLKKDEEYKEGGCAVGAAIPPLVLLVLLPVLALRRRRAKT